MGKRLDSRRSRRSGGGVRRETMAKQHQLELIARDKTERTATKKKTPKAALKVASKPRPKPARKAAAKAAPVAALKALPRPSPKGIVRLTANDMAARQREISVSEFFTK